MRATRERLQQNKDQFIETSLNLRPKQRIDIAIIMGILGGLGLLFVCCWFGVLLAKSKGWLEHPVKRPITDERILRNVRETPSQPFLDAVHHPPENRIYMSRNDGTVFRYHPGTHRFDQSEPLAGQIGIDKQFTILRSGCGADPQSLNHANCPDDESLWAVTADHALAQRVNGQWRIVVSNSRFVDANGERVSHDALTRAAVSEDGEWLCLGTQSQGLGFYHLPSRRWLPPVPNQTPRDEPSTKLPPQAAVDQLVWWRGYFWVGRSDGLWRANLRNGAPRIEQVLTQNFPILDLDIGADQQLWVLAEQSRRGKACMTLDTYASPNADPRRMFDAGERYDLLDLNRLDYALYDDPYLYLAGLNGIFRYNAKQRHWKRFFDLEPLNVLATHTVEKDRGFFFSAPNQSGFVTNGQITRYDLPDTIHQFTPGPDVILGLGRTGKLYQMSATGEPTPIYDATGSLLNPKSYQRAVATNRTVLFDGDDGMMLHDPFKRTYTDFAKQDLPHFLQDNHRLHLAGNQLYSFIQQGNRSERVFSAPITRFANRWADTSAFESTIDAGVVKVRPWEGDQLAVIDQQHRLWRLAPNQTEAMTGEAGPVSSLAQVTDITPISNGIRLVGDPGILDYSYATRGWTLTAPHPPDDRITDLAGNGPQPFAVTQKERLVRWNGSNWAQVAGGFDVFQFNNNSLSDVAADSGMIYLAGNGHIQNYSPLTRDIETRWNLRTGADVALINILDGFPLSTSRQGVFWAENQILGTGDPAVNVSLNDNQNTLAVVRQKGNRNYLEIHPDKNQNWNTTICYFKNPQPYNPINAVEDAVELGGATYALLSDGGLDFYSLSDRSWFRGSNFTNPGGSRFYRLNQTLFMGPALGGGRVGWFDSYQKPEACADASSQVQLMNYREINVSAFAVNPSAGEAAWMLTSGEILRWSDNQINQELPDSQSQRPDPTALERAYGQGGDFLSFTAQDGVWSYHLGRRQWFFGGHNHRASLQDLNLEPDNGRWLATARIGRNLYSGSYQNAGALRLDLSFQPPTGNGMQGQATDLLQVYATNNNRIWSLVGQDTVDFYLPGERRWYRAASLSKSGDRTLQTLNFYDLLVENNQKTWRRIDWHSTSPNQPEVLPPYTRPPGRETALDQDGNLWELDQDSTLRQGIWQSRGIQWRDRFKPFILEPGTVDFALEEGSFTLFSQNNQLRFYHQGIDQSVSYDTSVPMNRVTYARRAAGRTLWLGNGDELLLISFNLRPQVTDRFTGVNRLVRSKDAVTWALMNGAWQFWDDRFAISNWRSPGVQLDKVWIYEGETPTAVKQGFLYHWKGDRFDKSLALPAQIDPQKIALLARSENLWWLVEGDHLLVITRELCEEELPIPPEKLPKKPDDPPPKPEIRQYACLEIQTRFPLADVGSNLNPAILQDMQTSEVITDGLTIPRLTLDFGKGQVFEFRYENNAVTWNKGRITRQGDGVITDEWPQLKNNVVSIQGRRLYNPVVDLDVSNGLYAKRPSSPYQLASSGHKTPTPYQPLDWGWISYQPQSKQFEVKTLGVGVQTIQREDFIQGGRFLFETAESLLLSTTGLFHAANRFGVWRYTDRDLPVAPNVDIRFLPMDWRGPFRAGHDRIFGEGATYRADQAQPETGTYIHTINIDQLQLREANPHGNSLTARIPVGGVSQNAFDSSGGFVWDHDRKGPTFIGNRLFMHCRIGLMPLDGYRDLDPGPSADALTRGRLHSDAGPSIYLNRGRDWWHREASGRWVSTKNPNQNRTQPLIDNNTWVWSMTNGILDIQLKDETNSRNVEPNPHQFSFFKNGRFQFSSDQFQDAAYLGDNLHLFTDAFHLEAKDFSILSSLNATRHAPRPVQRLQTFTEPGRSPALFHTDSRGVLTAWDGSQFTAPAWDPYKKRVLVETPRLKFTALNNRQTIQKELKVDQPSGGSVWAEFQFLGQRFPFDRFTALDQIDDQLYLGTKAGLQVGNSKQTSLTGITTHLDMRTGSNQPLPTVTRVGKPDLRQDPVAAVTERASLIFRGGSWSMNVGGVLDTQPLVQDDFWKWERLTSGSLRGSYRDTQTGTFMNGSVALKNGWFIHDRFQDLVRFGKQTFQIQPDGWITVYPGANLEISGSIHRYSGFPIDLAWVPATRNYKWTKTLIPNGLYTVSKAKNQIMVYSPQNNSTHWPLVSKVDLTEDLVDFADKPPVWYTDNLRLRQPSRSGFQFSWRDQTNTWRTIPWIQRSQVKGSPWCVAIDEWQHVFYQDLMLWAESPFGFLGLNLDHDTPQLDPNRMVIIREQDGLKATDSGRFDDQVVFRFDHDGDKIYTADFGPSKDRDVFQRLTEADPFVETEWVNETFWNWRRDGRMNGAPGRLIGEFKGERIEIDSGRFRFDTINSLAWLDGPHWNLGTYSGGWYRLNMRDMHLEQQHRPVDSGLNADEIARVNQVAESYGSEADGKVIMLSTIDEHWFIIPNQSPEKKKIGLEIMAEDTLWRYQNDGNQMMITTPKKMNGDAIRKLEDGRFGDDWIIGPPAPGHLQDQIRYMVPSRVGILELDDHLLPRRIHAPPFGEDEQGMPTSVWFQKAGTPTYALDGETYDLLSRERLPDYAFKIPEGAMLESMEWGPYYSVRHRWRAGSQQGWGLSWKDYQGAFNFRNLDMADSQLLRGKSSSWGFLTAELGFYYEPQNKRVRLVHPKDRALNTLIPMDLNLLEMVPYRHRLLLFGQEDLWEINTEAAFESIVHDNIKSRKP